MKTGSRFAGVAIGFVLGLVAALIGWAAMQFGALREVPTEHPRGAERTQLAATLMRRVATSFVDAGSWRSDAAEGTFFDQPKPYGDILCRVRIYEFAQRVVLGDPKADDHSPAENLTVSDFYALRAEPGASDAQCARFRDFDHLIRGDGVAVERAVNVLDQAIRAARAGHPQFQVTCRDNRHSLGVVCDGVALLRRISIHDILQVSPIRSDYPWDDPFDHSNAKGSTYWDMLYVRPPTNGQSCHASEAPSETLMLRLESYQTFGRQAATDGDPKSLVISRDIEC